jgi:uncharacterized protein YndB with AHSA1/START domain
VPKPEFVYVTYIETTPERLWRALIEPEFTRQWWLGYVQQCDWTTGADWRLVSETGEVADAGKVLEIDPPRHLVLAWRHELNKELHDEGFSRATFDLEPIGDLVKLTITHAIDVPDSKLIVAVSGGWPLILSNLKSLLERGATLRDARSARPKYAATK